MDSPDAELEHQLLQAGNQLLSPPSSVQDLLTLLDQVDNCLSKVEQSPSEPMQTALSASQKALISDPLLTHSDIDVKVAVASCISEITRITAPDAPYDDEKMKAVFHLIVSSFENISDNSSRSFMKRVTILETVAKVRSCVVMLDLECDDLILEMFRCFLKNIRDYHPENVFSSMERIMTLVLEESEDISVELLTPILAFAKKNNEEVLPIARKLGEKVLENCSTKLKPYITQAVKQLGVSLEDCSDIVSSLCQAASSSVEQDDFPAASKKVETAVGKLSESVMGNGSATNVDNVLGELEAKKEDGKLIDQSRNSDRDNLDLEKEIKAEEKQERITKRRGRKPKFMQKSKEPSESSLVNTKKTSENLSARKGDGKKFAPNSPCEKPLVQLVPSENKKGVVMSSAPMVLENESPSPSGCLPEELRTKRVGRKKKRENLDKEAIQSADDTSKKLSEAASDSEVKSNRRSGKKAIAEVSDENTTNAAENASEKETDLSDEKQKALKQLSGKLDGRDKDDSGSSLKQSEEKKRRGQGKGSSAKDGTAPMSQEERRKSASKLVKEKHDEEETSRTSLKRKRTPGKEKESNSKEFGEDLVTKKVKVWWPKDQMFYEGAIDSFDPYTKKHKVVYTDGDEEVLNLSKEKWEFIEDYSKPELAPESPPASPDTSLDTPLIKKARPNTDRPAKQGKMDSLAKKSSGTSFGKLQGSTGRTSKDGSKVEGISKDSASKTAGKALNSSRGKTKDHTSGDGSSKISDAVRKSSSKLNKDDETPKASKSKDDETIAPRISTKSKHDAPKSGKSKQDKQDTPKSGKSKQQTPMTSSLSKGKTPKIGGKSNANGRSKVKSSSRTRESGDLKEYSSDSVKVSDSERASDDMKGKSINSSQAEGGVVKSGEKRKRGPKSR